MGNILAFLFINTAYQYMGTGGPRGNIGRGRVEGARGNMERIVFMVRMTPPLPWDHQRQNTDISVGYLKKLKTASRTKHILMNK